MKKWILFVTFATILVNYALGETGDIFHLNHYPSFSQAKKIKNSYREGFIRFLKIGTEDQSILGNYPSDSHVQNLNWLAPLPTSLYLATSAYPYQRASDRINQLQNHIALHLTLTNCLTTKAEADRLSEIQRPVNILIYCPSVSGLRKAKILRSAITDKNNYLSIAIILSRD